MSVGWVDVCVDAGFQGAFAVVDASEAMGGTCGETEEEAGESSEQNLQLHVGGSHHRY